MMGRVAKAVWRKGTIGFEFPCTALFHYAQIRHMYQHGNLWEPRLADLSEPGRVEVGRHF